MTPEIKKISNIIRTEKNENETKNEILYKYNARVPKFFQVKKYNLTE